MRSKNLFSWSSPLLETNDIVSLLVCRISYLDIFKVVELTCDKHRNELVTSPSLEEIVHYDLWAREYAANLQLSSGARPVNA